MKVYPKMLLLFFGVLFVTEVLVLYLFLMVPVRHFNTRFREFGQQRIAALKEVVEEKTRSMSGVPWSQNTPLKTFVSDFGRLTGAKIWLTDNDDRVVITSFAGEPPPVPPGSKRERRRRFFFFTPSSQGLSDFHAIVPVNPSAGQRGAIHILYDRQDLSPRTGHFALGLGLIGLFVALSIVPISRLFTGRIKALRASALAIAAGDLSHRASARGKDEIAELARAFNEMTDRLENMIVSGRELTANVSHELRTPLARIRIAEELLRERAEQGGGAEYLDAIREDIDELDGLIGRILELSKLDARESSLKDEPLDPSAMIKGLIDKLGPAIDKKGLNVATSLTYVPPFSADKEALRSALMNVCENAVKFTPENGDIVISTSWRSDSVSIRVANTYERLSDEDLVRIFDPFHRAARSGARGTGLGLAITKKAVERHGGTITARNTDSGLEIEIVLPRSPLKRVERETASCS